VLSVGDRAFGAELLREDPKSRVVLSRAWALKRKAWEKVVEASEKNETVTGRVVSASAKGLVVDVGVRGFVPSSHLELSPVSDVSSYRDQSLELRILEVDPRKEKLVLSRRSLLLRAQRKEMQELLNSLKKGEVRSGTVASLTDYGAFVDLGGVSGLVHISELSWQRVGRPGDVVSVGDQVEVKVLDVKPKKKRISLSLRQTSPDPLLTLEVGAVVSGRVTRLVDFGAFVAVGDAEGLVHLSELAEYRVISPEEVVAQGTRSGSRSSRSTPSVAGSNCPSAGLPSTGDEPPGMRQRPSAEWHPGQVGELVSEDAVDPGDETDPTDGHDGDDEADESRLASYAAALADGIEAALPGWVAAAVARRLPSIEGEQRLEAIASAGQAAAADVGARVRELLSLDIDEQWTNPLSLIRSAIRYPNQILADAGVVEVARDAQSARFQPDDVYDLAPASFADLAPELHDLGISWGAAKAHVHLRRRRREQVG